MHFCDMLVMELDLLNDFDPSLNEVAISLDCLVVLQLTRDLFFPFYICDYSWPTMGTIYDGSIALLPILVFPRGGLKSCSAIYGNIIIST